MNPHLLEGCARMDQDQPKVERQPARRPYQTPVLDTETANHTASKAHTVNEGGLEGPPS